MPHCRICLLDRTARIERVAFLNRVRDWLLEIDILACCQRIDGHADVPVVGRCDVRSSISLFLSSSSR